MKNYDVVLKIREKVREVVLENKLINDDETVVVGVSGGPDSMCLLDILYYLQKNENMNFHIVVAHVNHMIRPESYDEKEYVERVCKSLDIPFYYKEVDVKSIAMHEHISEETCGRNIRYEFFNEISKKSKNSKIAVAHNLNDDVETIILNLIRGCGLNGLTGIKYTNNNIIRPLLDIEKKDILEYNTKRNIYSCFDVTNTMDIYTRNKVRLNLLPVLKNEYNPNIMESIIRMKHILELDNEFLEEYVQKVANDSIIEITDDKIIFDFSTLVCEHESIKRRFIIKIIGLKIGSIDGIGNIHIKDILKLLDSGITGKMYIFGKKFRIKILKKHIAMIY